MAEDTTGALRQKLPRHQIAVMLHHREQHLIAFAEGGITPAARHKIDRFTGVSREDNLTGAMGTNKGSCCGSSRFKRLGGPGAELMGTTMHIGVIAAVITLHRIDHLLRLLTGRSVVEIDQWPTIWGGLSEYWKISTTS